MNALPDLTRNVTARLADDDYRADREHILFSPSHWLFEAGVTVGGVPG